ncbi:MAG: fumarate hydratase C-terminal domain-containing protein [Verrucomicrobia bacterium]|nr:fumarate hydratase C-terminal domain-containing protein [Verrucomicrobiota bacterium]
MIREIKHPYLAGKIRELKVGDRLRLSGPLLTARCRVHKHLLDGGEPPVDLENAAIYHCSPIIVKNGDGWSVRAASPAASVAVDTYVAAFLERFRIRIIIGMGSLGEATRKACAARGCVYAQAVSGAASKLGENIKVVHGVHFLKEFGSAEAMWELEASQLEAIVTIDARGRSLHRRVRAASKRALLDLL